MRLRAAARILSCDIVPQSGSHVPAPGHHAEVITMEETGHPRKGCATLSSAATSNAGPGSSDQAGVAATASIRVRPRRRRPCRTVSVPVSPGALLGAGASGQVELPSPDATMKAAHWSGGKVSGGSYGNRHVTPDLWPAAR